MTCSKIFSGDLPELTNKIIQFCRNDYLTLRSCILVNRLWCRLTIPLLWEDPFTISTFSAESYRFIEIYLHFLNHNDRARLIEHGINIDFLPSNPLFDYPSFIRYLDTYKIFISINVWISYATVSLSP